jgi:hypothetical protein
LGNEQQQRLFSMQADGPILQFNGQAKPTSRRSSTLYRDATDDATAKLAGQSAAQLEQPDACSARKALMARSGGAIDQAKGCYLQ